MIRLDCVMLFQWSIQTFIFVKASNRAKIDFETAFDDGS